MHRKAPAEENEAFVWPDSSRTKNKRLYLFQPAELAAHTILIASWTYT